MSKTKAILILLLCVVAQVGFAQGRVISGTVEDSMGPIMMANVVERDANNRIVSAVQTDMMGNFSMEIKSPKNKLVISYVGSKTKTITIGDQTTFAIKLEDENTTLKEVTVKGRRTNSGGLSIPKKEITTSQQTFDLSEVEGMAFTSVDEALQGEIAGLDIVANSGNLGSGTSMRLRGVTTINGNAEPLIVVDEKIFDNPDESFDFTNATEDDYASLLSVNPEDIAKIDVLKDASATAIWGSKGANGVISITTKRGSRGKPRVNFSYKFTGTWQPDGYDLLSGDDYTMMLKEEYYNPSQSSTATTNIREINYDKSWSEYENWNNNTDWVKAVQQFGQMHSYNLSITGGGQKAQFRISGGYDHQTGSIIQQKLDRLTTRLVLDYNVSDRIRFSTNFALTYTDNLQNYADLLNKAQKMAPNMSIYRQDANGNDTNEFYIMNPSVTGMTPADGNYSSTQLSSIRSLGNPLAYAAMSWKEDQTYRITPDFTIKYDLLGIESGQHRLTFNGRVDFDIYARSLPAYAAAGLTTDRWNNTLYYNTSDKTESNRLRIGARAELVFTPYFKNEDFSLTMLARYEMSTQKSNTQYVRQYNLPDGITSPTAPGAIMDYDSSTKTYGLTSSNSRANSQNIVYNAHFSYKGRYSLGFSLRADGDSKFGPKQKWAYFPGLSLRYNVSEEKFFEPLLKVVSMLGLRASWGIVGKAPDADYLFYNNYVSTTSYNGQEAYKMESLKLDDLRWEKTTSYNLGFNLGLINDRIEIDFDYYHKNTEDLLQAKVGMPSTTGYSQLAYQNIGTMTNDGWELNVSSKKLVTIGKLTISAGFNLAQNYNELTELDDRVLNSANSEWVANNRGMSKKANSYLQRVQVGNPIGSIYGYRYKGVYQYTYDYLTNLRTEKGWTADEFEANINAMLAEGKTFPVVVGTDGKVIMQSNGLPQRMVYNYDSEQGSTTYSFQGGDAIYEDINHDGQINSLDVVYLGNSLPKISGGFNVGFTYGQWNLKARFMFRAGNKVVNLARMNLESMSSAYNQCSTVNYRWRKDGDVTMIPRAMFVNNDNSAYNFQGSDRFVEDGSFLRFQNLQVGYTFKRERLKAIGLSELKFYVTVNNLFCWTKYSGVDPEINTYGWGPAFDDSQTPRAKSFTANINIGF